MISTRIIRRLALLAAVPAAALSLAVPAASASPAAHAAPAVTDYFICANGGDGLCLQNNGDLGSYVANDNSNDGATQEYNMVLLGTTSSTYPFNTSALNGDVASGRKVWLLQSVEAGGGYCLDENDGSAKINDCTGSQSEWVQSGSGRMVSVGASDQEGYLGFLDSTGVSGGYPPIVGSPYQTCPGACWSNF